MFNPFMENTYVLSDDTKEAIIVDPGCYVPRENLQLTDYIEKEQLKPVMLINTHGHIDHVFGNKFVKEKYNIELYIHEKDLTTLQQVKEYAPAYGFDNFEEAVPDHFLDEGDTVKFGHSSLEVLFVPGHAPGHIALVERSQKLCVSGDVLFHRSIGRTDLPGGDTDQLISSIHHQLFALPGDTVVYAGHGETTTIEDEMMYNPFCAVK